MMQALDNVQTALNHVLTSKTYLLTAAGSAFLMAGMTLYVPVVLTPGNTVAYQLSLMNWYNFVLIGVFSMLFGLTITIYHRAARLSGSVRSLFTGGSGSGVAGFTGALFSSPVCVSCLSTIFAALGLGGSAAITLFQHQTTVQAASVAMLGVSLYFASAKHELNCTDCDPVG